MHMQQEHAGEQGPWIHDLGYVTGYDEDKCWKLKGVLQQEATS